MSRRHLVRAAALVVAGAALLTACTADDGEAPGGAGGKAPCDTSNGTMLIAVIAPLSGELTVQGKGIENSTRLAVNQANQKCAVNGYRLAVQAEDDRNDPQTGAQLATKLATTPNVVGVVSTLNSSVSEKVQPILDKAGILQISPANTADSLTRGEDFLDNPKRRFPTYFRTCTVDSLQGAFAANYLVEKIDKKDIAIVTDGLTYGESLADSFSAQAEEKGATIVTRQLVGPDVRDFAKVIAALKPFEPDAVYFGGQFAQAAPLSKQLAAAGVQAVVMGDDGFVNDTFIALGGREGDLATSVGAPTEDLDTAKTFVKAYQSADYDQGFGTYGAFAHDAANAIIAALADTVGDGKWSNAMRPELVANVEGYEGAGATGEVSFDEFGDSTNRLLTVYQVTDGRWAVKETGEFAD